MFDQRVQDLVRFSLKRAEEDRKKVNGLITVQCFFTSTRWLGSECPDCQKELLRVTQIGRGHHAVKPECKTCPWVLKCMHETKDIRFQNPEEVWYTDTVTFLECPSCGRTKALRHQ